MNGKSKPRPRAVSELGLRVRSVYIGGGTPTVLSASGLDRLLSCLGKAFDLSGAREYTVEAGRPDTIDSEKLTVLKEHGVTRISVNPQSLDDAVLSAVGRGHTAQDIYEAYALARKAGLKCINMDLIAGLPGDSAPGFERSLNGVLSLRPEKRNGAHAGA